MSNVEEARRPAGAHDGGPLPFPELEPEPAHDGLPGFGRFGFGPPRFSNVGPPSSGVSSCAFASVWSEASKLRASAAEAVRLAPISNAANTPASTANLRRVEGMGHRIPAPRDADLLQGLERGHARDVRYVGKTNLIVVFFRFVFLVSLVFAIVTALLIAEGRDEAAYQLRLLLAVETGVAVCQHVDGRRHLAVAHRLGGATRLAVRPQPLGEVQLVAALVDVALDEPRDRRDVDKGRVTSLL